MSVKHNFCIKIGEFTIDRAFWRHKFLLKYIQNFINLAPPLLNSCHHHPTPFFQHNKFSILWLIYTSKNVCLKFYEFSFKWFEYYLCSTWYERFAWFCCHVLVWPLNHINFEWIFLRQWTILWTKKPQQTKKTPSQLFK